MQIDCYGFEASSQWFRRKELEVYLMKEVEGILYLCYGNQPMWRIPASTTMNTDAPANRGRCRRETIRLRRARPPLRQGRRRLVKPATSGPMVEWLLDAVGGGCGAEDGYAHALGRWIVRPWRM